MEKQQKKKSAITAGLLALVLLITGTFAWTSISQKALNAVKMTTEAGGRLHDDYNKEGIEDGSKTEANKDIYAENYGQAPLYVRIKLTEFLQVDNTVLTAGERDDQSTWQPYSVIDSVTNTTIPLPTTGPHGNSMAGYVTWDMGGSKTFLPTFNKDNTSDITDVSGDAIEGSNSSISYDPSTKSYVGQQDNHYGDGTHDYFINNPDDVIAYERYAEGATSDNEETHTPKPTLTEKYAPMSMAQWIADGKQTGPFWVIDTDGWAYWAELLQTGEATSLLLNNLQFNKPDGEMYYAIHVISEFATQADIFDFWEEDSAGAPSTDAGELLDEVGGITTTYSIEITPNLSEMMMQRDESQTFTVKVYATKSNGDKTEITDTNIEWILENAKDATALKTGTKVENGRVTIDNTETLEELRLTISVPEHGTTKTVAIHVEQPAIEIPATGTFQDPDTGTLWRVLVPDDGNGNTLIITENVFERGTLYNTTNVYKLYESANLKTVMDSWYNNNVGSTIKSIALDYAYNNGNKGTTGAGIEYDWTGNLSFNAFANLGRAKTKAGDSSTKGNGSVFALSISEANTYFTSDADRIAKDTSGAARDWWLRSPGTSSTYPASNVYMGGDVSYDTSMPPNVGFRPALWVRK